MHLVVVGAGALGSLFGASMWLGGDVRVTLVGRDEHIRAINDHGLLLSDRTRGDVSVSGSGFVAVTDVARVDGVVDYLLIAVKDRDLDGALRAVLPLRSRVRCVFSLQNGVDHDERIGAALGADKVLGALTMEGAAMPVPGVVEHMLSSTTYLGEFSGETSTRAALLAEALRRGHLHTEVVADVAAAKWTKFVQSCAASGLCGVSRIGYAPATRSEAGARLYVDLVAEGVAVMKARGLEPGQFFTDTAPVRAISTMPADEAVELVRRLADGMIERGYVGSTSLARDLQAGRPSEVDALMGSMCRTAERLGVATPTMHAVYWAIKAADESLERP
jgi:2-dehydropantoate 2-reductase